MADHNNPADPDRNGADLASTREHQALRQRLHEAGYAVLEVQPGQRGLVWTLAPQDSHVEFQLIGTDELLRFLDHH